MNSRIKEIIDEYMSKVESISSYCNKCLQTRRWGGNVVLMVVDASFTSIGLNYFTAVVPKVLEFDRLFVKTGYIKNLKGLSLAPLDQLKVVWKNQRSWNVATMIARVLSNIDLDDREAFRKWAKESNLEKWKEDPIGRIKGVGLVTYQYLRMMGGIDTVMPDKIVKKVLNEILEKAGLKKIENDMHFILKIEEIAKETGYRPIELTWMTWLIQSEGDKIRMNKYKFILDLI
jgi:hypothetical protein